MSLNLEDRNKKANDIHEGKLGWIPDENPLALNLWESDQIFFPWIRDGKLISAKFDYDGDEMREHHVVFHSEERQV